MLYVSKYQDSWPSCRLVMMEVGIQVKSFLMEFLDFYSVP